MCYYRELSQQHLNQAAAGICWHLLGFKPWSVCLLSDIVGTNQRSVPKRVLGSIQPDRWSSRLQFRKPYVVSTVQQNWHGKDECDWQWKQPESASDFTREAEIQEQRHFLRFRKLSEQLRFLMQTLQRGQFIWRLFRWEWTEVKFVMTKSLHIF